MKLSKTNNKLKLVGRPRFTKYKTGYTVKPRLSRPWLSEVFSVVGILHEHYNVTSRHPENFREKSTGTCTSP